jgi:hypothetical protein
VTALVRLVQSDREQIDDTGQPAEPAPVATVAVSGPTWFAVPGMTLGLGLLQNYSAFGIVTATVPQPV